MKGIDDPGDDRWLVPARAQPRLSREECRSSSVALAAAGRYYVLAAGRVTSSGDGGTDAHELVRAAMAM